MLSLSRRTLLCRTLPALGAAAVPATALTQGRVSPRAESPRIATDPLFISSGLSGRWQAAMRQDLGWAARFESLNTRSVLSALEQGSVPAGLFLSHPYADVLDKKGLIYDRHNVARTDVLLVGPADDVAGIRGEQQATRALLQVLAACRAGVAQWHPLEPDSSLEAVANQLTQGQLRALLSLMATRPPSSSAPTYRLMTRAQWQTAPLKARDRTIWLQGGPDMPELQLHAQVACAFHARHPGAKLLVSWLQWPLAQKSVQALRPGWQPLKA